MKIVAVDTFLVEVPMLYPISPYQSRYRAASTTSSLLVRIEADDGTVGWGESPQRYLGEQPRTRPYRTGHTQSRRRSNTMSDVTIRIRDHGPLVVEGPIKVVDSEGNTVPLDSSKPAFAFCRCGASANKPFCDGSHRDCKFESAPRA